MDRKALEEKIAECSNGSRLAPKEFLLPEMRRFWNISLLEYPHFDIRESDFRQVREMLETEYMCYFETEKFRKQCECTTWWKRTYAGCNSQIEYFLLNEGLGDAAEKLGFGEEFNPLKEIGKKELPKKIWRYLAGIGFLYPKGNRLIVHPNMLLGQNNSALSAGDSPFLTRDLIRCPYHEEHDGGILEENELWDYWKDLAALSIARLPECILYRVEDFRNPEKRSDKIKNHLELGKKFLPQRYIELKPKMEKFEWVDG